MAKLRAWSFKVKLKKIQIFMLMESNSWGFTKRGGEKIGCRKLIVEAIIISYHFTPISKNSLGRKYKQKCLWNTHSLCSELVQLFMSSENCTDGCVCSELTAGCIKLGILIFQGFRCLHPLIQGFSSCGSWPLWGPNYLFMGVTHQISCISDVYIKIPKSSKITVLK